MKVWVCLFEIQCEGYVLPEHIFAKKEDAEQWLASKPKPDGYDEYSIEEYEVE